MADPKAPASLPAEGKKDGWVVPVLVMVVGAFMAILDSSIVNVAIPTMMSDFQTTMSRIQWVTTIYMLTLGVIVPTSGWLSDRLGYKRLYIWALAVFTVGSGLCSLAWNENVLIAARVVQAFGGGMIMPVTMSMIYLVVPRDKMGSATGIFGLAMLFAPAVGPTLGGYLVEYVNWRWIFTINIPIGILGVFLAIGFVPNFPSRPAGKFDLLGFFTSSAGLFCLLLALSQGQDWGWTSLSIVLLFYFSAALLGVFVYHQLTTENPLLELRVFKFPTYTIGNLMLIVLNIVMFAGLFYIPFYMQTVKGLGALTTGLLMLPPALASGLMMPLAGRLYDKVGPMVPVAGGLLLMTIATYLFHKIDVTTPLSTIIGWNVIRSVGMGLSMMPLNTVMMSVVPQELIGRGSAIANIVSRVSSSFGLAILTMYMNNLIQARTAYLTWSVSGQNLSNFLAAANYNQQVAMGLLKGNISMIAFTQALNDIFIIMAVVSIFAFLPSFLLRKGKVAAGGHVPAE